MQFQGCGAPSQQLPRGSEVDVGRAVLRPGHERVAEGGERCGDDCLRTRQRIEFMRPNGWNSCSPTAKRCEMGFGLRISGVRCQLAGFEFRVSASRFRVSGSSFRISGLGFRVSGSGLLTRRWPCMLIACAACTLSALILSACHNLFEGFGCWGCRVLGFKVCGEGVRGER